MSAQHPDEIDEWVTGRVESWVETYKKAMLTPVILHLVAAHQPVTITDLTDYLTAATGWQVTERGLYRSVRRLQDSGLLAGEEVEAPRTGAKRKRLTLSPVGDRFLSGLDAHLISVPDAGAPAS